MLASASAMADEASELVRVWLAGLLIQLHQWCTFDIPLSRIKTSSNTHTVLLTFIFPSIKTTCFNSQIKWLKAHLFQQENGELAVAVCPWWRSPEMRRVEVSRESRRALRTNARESGL
jgi:hypothetical protein